MEIYCRILKCLKLESLMYLSLYCNTLRCTHLCGTLINSYVTTSLLSLSSGVNLSCSYCFEMILISSHFGIQTVRKLFAATLCFCSRRLSVAVWVVELDCCGCGTGARELDRSHSATRKTNM